VVLLYYSLSAFEKEGECGRHSLRIRGWDQDMWSDNGASQEAEDVIYTDSGMRGVMP